MECISCKGREGSFSFKTIEVRTILNPGRNSLFKKNRIPATRTQKLGDLRELSVCDDCIEKRYHEILHPWKEFLNTCKVGVILFVIGLALIVFYIGRQNILAIGGAALIALALYRFLKYWGFALRRKDEYMKFSEDNRRFALAWEIVSQSAPKRDGVESIYFVPITKATENMKREDFMKYYGLTKENADQFHKMLHGKFKAASRDLGQDSLDDREPNTELTEND